MRLQPRVEKRRVPGLRANRAMLVLTPLLGHRDPTIGGRRSAAPAAGPS